VLGTHQSSVSAGGDRGIFLDYEKFVSWGRIGGAVATEVVATLLFECRRSHILSESSYDEQYPVHAGAGRMPLSSRRNPPYARTRANLMQPAHGKLFPTVESHCMRVSAYTDICNILPLHIQPPGVIPDSVM
jgi:hypothetical protein